MKKILTLLLVAAVVLSLAVTVHAEDYEPTMFKTAKGTATVDGVMDDAYHQSDEIAVEKGGLDRELLEGHATAKVRTLWDDEYLYVYAEVNDPTPGGVPTLDDPAWENESVEIYVDYENNKDPANTIKNSSFACQLRICRYPDSYPDITGEGLMQSDFAENTTYKVIDNGEDGYIVEASVKHGSPTGKIGFSLQINDDMDGDKVRDSIVYVSAEQKDAWQYTYLLDTIELEGYVAPEVTSSEETSSVAESSEEASSADASVDEESSEAPSLGLDSSAPVIDEAELDPVISIVVFAIAVVAIAVVIIVVSKKK